jgi:hypothetical protein
MADGFKPIPRCKKGGDSLVSAEYANQLIDLLNALGGMTVAPIQNTGKFMVAGGRGILDLAAFDARLRAVEGSAGAIGSNATFPFQINDTSPNANYASVNVRYGSIGAIIPNGISADIPLTIPNSNTSLYLEITIDANAAVTAVNVNTGATPTPNTAYAAYAHIGNVRVIDNIVSVIDQDLMFSQSFVSCNRNTSDPETTPGTYFLQVS